MAQVNNLDDIVSCSIEISSPASSDESFNDILMVILDADGTATTEMPDIAVITAADELKVYGYTSSSEAYAAAAVAFSQNPRPARLYVTKRQKENSVYEDITVTLARALKYSNTWYGIYLCNISAAADLLACAQWTETQSKIFGFEYSAIGSFPLSNKNFYRTFAVYANDSTVTDQSGAAEGNKYFALGWMAKCFGYTSGSETWAFKTVATANVASLDSSQKNTLNGSNITFYVNYAGKNVTSNMGGKVLAGEWIDVIRFRDWLKNKIQTNVFNVISSNSKLPFTSAGITAVEGAMEAALLEGQNNGGVAPTEYDSAGEAVPGYTITVPAIGDISETDKKNRTLAGCKFSAKLAGAIQAVEVNGTLAF